MATATGRSRLCESAALRAHTEAELQRVSAVAGSCARKADVDGRLGSLSLEQETMGMRLGRQEATIAALQQELAEARAHQAQRRGAAERAELAAEPQRAERAGRAERAERAELAAERAQAAEAAAERAEASRDL